jgi:putative ABC transport system substrate-binding protein
MGPSSTTAPERRQRRRDYATFAVEQPITFARITVTTRREILVAAGSGLGLLAVPRLASAQRAEKSRRIGFLGTGTAAGMAVWVGALRAELRQLGHVEGQNLSIEYRWADGQYERAPELAAELVRLKVEVLVTHGTPGTLAAKGTTTTIPIVMATAGDAVLSGLVKSLAKPGGNVTGSTFFNPELAAKRLELAKEALPRLTKVASLINPDNPGMGPVRDAMAPTAKSLKLDLHWTEVRRPAEFEKVFKAMADNRVGAVVILEDGMFNANIQALASLAAAQRLPSVGIAEFAEAGGLMAYGVNFSEMYRRAAIFVDKILKGARPGDLPIERATKFETVLNQKAARAMGITFPRSVLVRADRTIE